MPAQLELFDSNVKSVVVKSQLVNSLSHQEIPCDWVILEERMDCFLLSTEAEKLNLIKVFALRRNTTNFFVRAEKDKMNDKLSPDSIFFYSCTELWRLEYLMPLAFASMVANETQRS